MSEIQYESWNPNTRSIAIVAAARSICEEYAAGGYDLTLRQLYYQFVSRGLIANTQRSYKSLGNTISKARMAGLLDWNFIVDRTRNRVSNAHWNGPGEIISSAAYSFKLDRWEDQENRIEVWIEKDALTGVIDRICSDLDVPYFACKGYVSQSEMWRAAQRQLGYEHEGKDGVIIHLGDHDPSGIDMTRDIQERMWTFGASPYVQRIALNMDQIEQYTPPPNPTKLTDSRANTYIDAFGYDSWELDALEPAAMTDLIRETILDYRDEDAHEETMSEETDIVQGLKKIARIPWDQLKEMTNV